MRTKILLASAAAMALGLGSSNAQVYSGNIVGYANVPAAGNGGYTLVANPVDDMKGNQLTNILTAAFPNKSQVITWNGTSFNTAIVKGASGWASSVSLPPGVGFFVKNGIAGSAPLTNTFAGNVGIMGLAGMVGNSETNTLAAGYSLVGSYYPYVGDATVDTNINLGATLPNKSQLIDWNSTTQVYDTADVKGSGVWGSPFNITYGQGFFIKTLSGTNWTQTLY
jgi:hypothetical protein